MAARGEGGRLQAVRTRTAQAAQAGRTAADVGAGTAKVVTPSGGSRSVGIILTAGIITIGNEFIQKPGSMKTFFRPAAAFLLTAWIFSGLEKLDEEAAVGLAAIVMITVLVGGVNKGYKSPAQELISLFGTKGAA